jgi:hypothetical protein
MNEMSTCGQENSLYEDEQEVPKIEFSLMRVMSRSWGKNVMKALLAMFQDKIKSLLETYQDILLKLADNFDEESSKKNFQSRFKNKYKLDQITRDILRQALLCILDTSVNELNVKMLNNSLLPLETFYLQIEEMLLNHTKAFMKTLFENYPINIFMMISEHY